MITLHHLNQSRSFRVVWLMEELGLPYDLVCHQRQANHAAPETLRTVAPLGHAPVIVDGKTVLFESGAILEYIIHRYGQGRLSVPCHHMDYAPYLTWLHAAEGTAMPALGPFLHAAFAGSTVNEYQKRAHGAVLALCDQALAENRFLGGADFTAADIMMQTYLQLAARITPDAYAAHGRLPGYVERLESRPAFCRAEEVTEPAALDTPA